MEEKSCLKSMALVDLNSENLSEGFICSSCGEWHQGLPLDWAFDSPLYWHEIPESQRPNRGKLNEDFCCIDDKHFFVRGIIDIPIIGTEKHLMWGVWVSLSQKNFERIISVWNDPTIVQEPPYFGWLSNRISIYPDTLNLKTNVSSRDVNCSPFIQLEPTDHPLAIEQRSGITLSRVSEIASLMIHGDKN
jgi:hypothetical protein